MGERVSRDRANFTAEQHEAGDRMKAGERKLNLHDLASVYRLCGEIIADHGGDMGDPSVQAALAALDEAGGSIDRKIDAIRELMADFKAQARSRREEANLRLARAQALETAVKRMEQWAIGGIERAGLTQAGSVIPLAVCNNGGKPRVEWTRIGEPIPEGFRKAIVLVELDKDEVYRECERGRGHLLPSGIVVHPRGKHLREVGLSRKGEGSNDVG